MMTIRLAFFGIAAATAAPVAMAFEDGAGRGPIAIYCASDIGRYCAQDRHGAGNVRACLETNWRRLSRKCRSELSKTGFGDRLR
jgi:hypothetical protein